MPSFFTRPFSWVLMLSFLKLDVLADSNYCLTIPCPERCESWNPEASAGLGLFFNLCDGLIDYNFYIPENVTQATLGTIAATMARGFDGALSFWCLGTIKRDVCAKVYLPCPKQTFNISMEPIEDNFKWNNQPLLEGGISALPFNRSCRSGCQAIVDSCGTEGELLGAIPDCDEISNTTGVGVYSSSSEECTTTLSSSTLYVASGIEPYLYASSGTCAGMVDYLYTGVWDPVSVSRSFMFGDLDYRPSLALAPLLGWYLNQVIVEILVDILWRMVELSTFSRSDECIEADRMFMCGIAFPYPQKQDALDSHLPYFYIPQRSSREACNKLVETCQSNSYNIISVSSYELGGPKNGPYLSAWDSVNHCYSTEESLNNMSWYAETTEVIAELSVGNITRSPYNISRPPTKNFLNYSICPYYYGINHHSVDVSRVDNIMDPWADPATGMGEMWWKSIVASEVFTDDVTTWAVWDNRICPSGWGETNKQCPFKYRDHSKSMQCFKTCFQWGNNLNPMRDPQRDEDLNDVDYALLWVMLVLMTFMVLTWSVFREKRKQRIVLVLSILMLLQTFIELLGYIIYPSSEERYCESPAVPHHHGFNYCAVSAMLVVGLINPMFQVMMALFALDVYIKIILEIKNNHHFWKYYTGVAFIVCFFFKFLPVFLVMEAAGFDGVNACGFTFLIRQPRSANTPTPVNLINPKLDMDLSQILLLNTVDHVAWLVSVALFMRIIYKVIKTLQGVGQGGASSFKAAIKQFRVVKTPVLMIFFFSVISAVQIYFWDVYAIENWQYFGPGDEPMAKTYNDAQAMSIYYQFKNEGGPIVVYSQWETIDDLTRILSYYYKIIGHVCFPVLLFLVFGLQFENVKLWAKFFNLGDFSASYEPGYESTEAPDFSKDYGESTGQDKWYSFIFRFFKKTSRVAVDDTAGDAKKELEMTEGTPM